MRKALPDLLLEPAKRQCFKSRKVDESVTVKTFLVELETEHHGVWEDLWITVGAGTRGCVAIETRFWT